MALQDTKGDGHADVIRRFGPGVESGNAGGTGIALYKGALYVETNDRIVRYASPPGAITPSRDPDVIVSGLPLTGDHPMQKAILLKSRFQEEQKWAAKGVIELISIRNAIVHNNSVWNQKALEELAAADIAELPKPGTPLRLGIDDLFRYRRAVRTSLNLIKNLPAGGS